jgi:hypothetical protein
MPAATDTKKHDLYGEPAFAYTAATLHRYAAEFLHLTNELLQIAIEIVARAQTGNREL